MEKDGQTSKLNCNTLKPRENVRVFLDNILPILSVLLATTISRRPQLITIASSRLQCFRASQPRCLRASQHHQCLRASQRRCFCPNGNARPKVVTATIRV
ncbi:hypothetical protein EUGRSUZ_J00116 [Eucalyptus grandis]|uniref:Uncharacterized protein n=2 Tax=Eucalyptus grandis TaxID=71139 RepID=A0ACC3J116_EUCGR|nr:hypothetical protein EUGRSUZ_J00116 [Eucalyptus grandis]